MAIKSKVLMQGLSKNKLKSLIFYLTKRYYEAYVEGDVEAYNMAIEQMFVLVEEYGDKYVNLQGFICYCLYLNANTVVMNAAQEQPFKLDPLFKMDLLEDNVEELSFDIKNIFNKQRIRERYNAKRTREHVE